MSSDVIVFDTAARLLHGNRVLDAEYARQFPGALFLAELKDLAKASGIPMVTVDVFLDGKTRWRNAVAISDAVTPYTKYLMRRGVRMGVTFSGESPNVMPWFYHRLGRYTRSYEHAVLFRSFASRTFPSVRHHHFYWPCPTDKMLPGPPFAERDLLVMVASNKQRFPVNPRRRISSLAGNMYRYAMWHYYETIDPMLRIVDLYELRLQALEAFANAPDFRLYGKGWDRDRGKATRIGRLPFAVWPTPCDDKLSTMSHFRFSLCFENCAFPGYVTEKIFDGLLAGSVPVYFGAPDIGEFCPRECFIDYRDYGSMDELIRALRSYPDAEWERKREASRAFLASPEFDPYRPGAFASKLLKWLIPGAQLNQ